MGFSGPFKSLVKTNLLLIGVVRIANSRPDLKLWGMSAQQLKTGFAEETSTR
jgi:hypothetical protein